ncbi:MAG: pyruvate dehydrogenase (acetyl-transferring) E1 component subunit alpha [Bacteroidales bacterium]|nr:pyruvate dehydrogenase (acetyl-transferring) E1 component subunit alpha [Bacteroidales bacterium]
MFKAYDPLENKLFNVMDDDGKIVNEKWMPDLADDKVLQAYKDMLFARTADLMTVNYQRQGRIYTYPPNHGQEAIAGGIAQIVKEDDWVVPAFRELGLWLAKGATLKDAFLYFMGYEDGSKFENAKHLLPISIPIATQMTHAVGVGYAVKYQGKDEVVYTFVGDGGTSEGDFHEALNFAGVWKVPVVFVIQNNHYAISVGVQNQTSSRNLAVKSYAYGIPGIQVDGNDFFAMTSVADYATKYAREGNGPVLIEALTYRKGAHTTSDDPSKYRTKEEEQQWEEKDPLKRMRAYLSAKDLWNDDQEEEINKQYKKEVERQFEEAENYGEYPLEDVFNYQYSEMPDDLKKQLYDHEKFLKWKEGK